MPAYDAEAACAAVRKQIPSAKIETQKAVLADIRQPMGQTELRDLVISFVTGVAGNAAYAGLKQWLARGVKRKRARPTKSARWRRFGLPVRSLFADCHEQAA
jgi:hypothetical protein